MIALRAFTEYSVDRHSSMTHFQEKNQTYGNNKKKKRNVKFTVNGSNRIGKENHYVVFSRRIDWRQTEYSKQNTANRIQFSDMNYCKSQQSFLVA